MIDYGYLWYVIGLYIIQTFFGILKQYISLTLIKGSANKSDVYNLIIVMFCVVSWSHITKRYIYSVIHKLSIKFWKEQYKRFGDTCYNDKTSMNTDHLCEKQTDAWYAIEHSIIHGIPRIIKILETTSLVVMAFIQTDSIVRCIIMVVIMITYWWNIIKPFGLVRTSISKEASTTRLKVASKIKLIIPFFAHHQMSKQDLYKAVKPSFKIEKKWNDTDVAYSKHIDIE